MKSALPDELSREVTMFENYLKISIRELVRTKQYIVINNVGRSVALTCCRVYLHRQFGFGTAHCSLLTEHWSHPCSKTTSK